MEKFFEKILDNNNSRQLLECLKGGQTSRSSLSELTGKSKSPTRSDFTESLADKEGEGARLWNNGACVVVDKIYEGIEDKRSRA